MKAIVIIIFLIVSLFTYCDDEEIIRLEAGQKAPFTGVLIPPEKYRQLITGYSASLSGKTLENNLELQLFKYQELLDIKEQELQLWKKKYELEAALRKDLEGQLSKSELRVRILTTTTGVAFSISLAELAGIGAFAILYYTLKQ